jgi:hypothetical protein
MLIDQKIDLEAPSPLITNLPTLVHLPSLRSAELSASTVGQEKLVLSEGTVQSNAVDSTSTTPSNITNQETSTNAEADVVPSLDGGDDTKMSTEGNTTVRIFFVVNVDNPQPGPAAVPIGIETLPSHPMVEGMERDIKSVETAHAVVTANSGGDVKESNNPVGSGASITTSVIEPVVDLQPLLHPVVETVSLTPTNDTWK